MSERLNENDTMDVLGDVLETLHFRGTIFFRSELAAPWGISLEPVGVPRFHIALAGNCVVGGVGEAGVEVDENEIIMLPLGDSHWIADQPDRDLVPADQAGEACELGSPLFQEGAITNRLMCGIVHYDQESPHPLLDSLPNILHFPAMGSNQPIWSTVSLIDSEMHRAHGRNRSIIDRLTEVLFLQLLSHYVENNTETTGFLAALRDRRMQHALTLIHQDPARNWTLAMLGEAIGMSRATLVRHFQEAVDLAPMTYVANWRIMKAYNMIKYGSTPLEQVAESVGFGSARTLTKAFQRHYSQTPSELRKSRDENI